MCGARPRGVPQPATTIRMRPAWSRAHRMSSFFRPPALMVPDRAFPPHPRGAPGWECTSSRRLGLVAHRVGHLASTPVSPAISRVRVYGFVVSQRIASQAVYACAWFGVQLGTCGGNVSSAGFRLASILVCGCFWASGSPSRRHLDPLEVRPTAGVCTNLACTHGSLCMIQQSRAKLARNGVLR